MESQNDEECTTMLIKKIKKDLPSEIFEIILFFVECNCVILGKERWKERIMKINREYKNTYCLHLSWCMIYNVIVANLVRKEEMYDSHVRRYPRAGRTFNYRCAGTYLDPLYIYNVVKKKQTIFMLPKNYWKSRK